MPAGGQAAPLRTAELERMGSWLMYIVSITSMGVPTQTLSARESSRITGSQAALTRSSRKLFRRLCLSS